MFPPIARVTHSFAGHIRGMTNLSPRRVAATAAFVLPLAVVAVAAPGIATSHAAPSHPAATSAVAPSATEMTDYGTLGSPFGTVPLGSLGLGDLWSGPFSGFGGGYGGDGSTVSSGQTNATDASATAESGVVMIDTVLDYDQGEAAGTGLVIGSDGLVVTNHHVVQGATSITVTTADGTQYPATVVGYDATHDVAVLQLQGASGLATVTPSATAATKGEKVDAIGNAEGEGVLTDASGTVLKPSVNIKVSDDEGGSEKLKNLIETSADVVPGDSGGALLDSTGQVVGMDVAAASANESGDAADDQGFAIPIAQVERIANKIVAGTATKYIVIGDSAAIGIEVSAARQQVVIEGVESQSAEKAGLEPGDVLTKVGSATVTNLNQLRKAIAKDKPGQTVTLTWTDTSGTTESGSVTLVDAPIP